MVQKEAKIQPNCNPQRLPVSALLNAAETQRTDDFRSCTPALATDFSCHYAQPTKALGEGKLAFTSVAPTARDGKTISSTTLQFSWLSKGSLPNVKALAPVYAKHTSAKMPSSLPSFSKKAWN